MSFFGIPIQLLASAGSFIFSFIARRSAQAQEIQAAERKHQMELIAAQSENYHKTLEAQRRLIKTDKTFSWTKRFLAVMMTTVFLTAALLFPYFFEPEWFWVSEQIVKGGSFFFGLFEGSGSTTTEIFTATGIPLVMFDAVSTMVSAIIGHYFGSSVARVNNPYRR